MSKDLAQVPLESAFLGRREPDEPLELWLRTLLGAVRVSDGEQFAGRAVLDYERVPIPRGVVETCPRLGP